MSEAKAKKRQDFKDIMLAHFKVIDGKEVDFLFDWAIENKMHLLTIDDFKILWNVENVVPFGASQVEGKIKIFYTIFSIISENHWSLETA